MGKKKKKKPSHTQPHIQTQTNEKVERKEIDTKDTITTNSPDTSLGQPFSAMLQKKYFVRSATLGTVGIGFSFSVLYWEMLLVFARQVEQIVNAFLLAIPIMLAFLAISFLSRLLFQLTTSFPLAKQVHEADNPAVGICFAGYLAGIGLSLIGATWRIVFAEDWPEFFHALHFIAVGFVIALTLIRITGILHSFLLFPEYSMTKEIVQDRNVGVGAVCFGGFVSTGLILMSSMMLQMESWKIYLISVVAIYLTGQVILIIGGICFQKFSKYNFHHEIEIRDNPAAGIVLSGYLIALGIVVCASITSEMNLETTEWWKSLGEQMLYCVSSGFLGSLLLALIGKLVVKGIFPKASIHEEICQKNIGMAIIIAVVYLIAGFSVLVLLHS